MKVAIVGAGKVGSACLLSLVMRGTARELAGHDRVPSTGTFLDTLRFRFHLARCLGVHPMSVDAQVLGEHGTSQGWLVEPHMTDGERKALDESANQLRRAVARLGSAGVS
jgi:malate/lactate dehydrogenase